MHSPRHVSWLRLVLPINLALVLSILPVRGQAPDDGVKLSSNENTALLMEFAREYLETKDWKPAFRAMQKLLDLPQDSLVPAQERQGGKTVTQFTSARAKAGRLLAALPMEAKLSYEKIYGPAAEALLAEARKDGDSARFIRVYELYPLTRAAGEALVQLARLDEQKGQVQRAAIALERLLQRRKPAGWTPGELYLAARVFTRVGDKGHAATVVAALKDRLGSDGVKVGEKVLKASDLVTELAKLTTPPTGDWPLLGGNPQRNAQAAGSAPYLDPLWRQPLTTNEEARAILAKSAEMLEQLRLPVLSASSPLIVSVAHGEKTEHLAIVKNWAGLQAVNLRTGKLRWEAASNKSLERFPTRPADAIVLKVWQNFWDRLGMGVLFENSVTGQASADDKNVYLVDDLPVPFVPSHAILSQEQTDLVAHNRLQAINLVTGKISWELGGRGAGDLADTHFLGAPLPVQGRLYVLNEKSQDLRLLTLDANGKVLATQPLAQVSKKIIDDPKRRLRAALLSYDRGILVCDANIGPVLGIDLLNGSLAWAQGPNLGQKDPELSPGKDVPMRGSIPGFRPGRIPDGMVVSDSSWIEGWRGSALIIEDGKVVRATSEPKAVQCLDLRDGSLLWSVKGTKDDLFVGGVADSKVLLVGSSRCRAVDLNKGTEVWTVPTGMPSGRGALSQGVYYLPMKADAGTGKAEVCAIDVAHGQVRAHIRSRSDVLAGNLVFAQGVILSQTPREIAAYPDLDAKLKQTEERVKANPKDPVTLGERGGLRRDQGNLIGAVEDLREALAGKLDAKDQWHFQERLFESLSELLKHDYKASEKFLPEYRALTTIEMPADLPAETASERKDELERRRIQSLQVIGQGRQSAGKTVEALETYLELAGRDTEEMLLTPDDPGLRVSAAVWARGHIEEMLAIKDDASRAPLEEAIDKRWKTVREEKDVRSLRGFADVLTGTPPGREARLLLAELLIKDREYTHAQIQLERLRRQKADPAMSGRAVLTLALLFMEQDRFQEAWRYYEILNREYGNIKVHQGKTGAELHDEMRTDKRFQPFVEAFAFPKGPLKANLEKGDFPNTIYRFTMSPMGEPTLFWQRYQLDVRTDNATLQLVDRMTGEQRWSQLLPIAVIRVLAWSFKDLIGPSNKKNIQLAPFRALGDFAVVPLGPMLIGFDPLKRKIVWEINLGNAPLDKLGSFPNVAIDPTDDSLLLTFPDGWSQRVGQTDVVTFDAVCVQTPAGLHGIDPLTGKKMWTRADLSFAQHLFGDDDYLFLLDRETSQSKDRATLVVRRRDGVRVSAPDFASAYSRQMSRHGRSLLLRDSDDKGVALRCYDVLEGKDVWSKTFSPKTLIITSKDTRLTGGAEPDGKVAVLDLASGKPLLQFQLEVAQMKNLEEVTLLSDDKTVYLALRATADPNVGMFGGVGSNFPRPTGLRSIPINGDLIALDPTTGKMRWTVAAPKLAVLLNSFAETPVLVLSNRYQRWGQQGGRRVIEDVATVKIIQKDTGKLCYDSEDPTLNDIHRFGVDAARGEIVITALKEKLRLEKTPK
jgi:outer membrane protein assembly factor BamB/tetratricopeptide (TPR) repeat protein